MAIMRVILDSNDLLELAQGRLVRTGVKGLPIELQLELHGEKVTVKVERKGESAIAMCGNNPKGHVDLFDHKVKQGTCSAFPKDPKTCTHKWPNGNSAVLEGILADFCLLCGKDDLGL